ncbi:hypothetical protein LINPERPRIM_LOCUS35192 [Linum perenne]
MAVRISPPSILLGTWLRCRCIRCLCCSRQPIPCHRGKEHHVAHDSS